VTKTATEHLDSGARGTHSTSWDVLGDFTTTTRLLPISAVAVGIGVVAAFVALALLRLIGFFTNLFYFSVVDLLHAVALPNASQLHAQRCALAKSRKGHDERIDRDADRRARRRLALRLRLRCRREE